MESSRLFCVCFCLRGAAAPPRGARSADGDGDAHRYDRETTDERAWRIIKLVRFRRCGELGDTGQGVTSWALSDFDPKKNQRMIALAAILEETGCVIKQGAAPPTTAERKLSIYQISPTEGARLIKPGEMAFQPDIG